jgi:integrase
MRHTAATTAARFASLAEVQARLGHSTVNAAMRYQHAVLVFTATHLQPSMTRKRITCLSDRRCHASPGPSLGHG